MTLFQQAGLISDTATTRHHTSKMQSFPLSISSPLALCPENIFGSYSKRIFTSLLSSRIVRLGYCKQIVFTVSSPSVFNNPSTRLLGGFAFVNHRHLTGVSLDKNNAYFIKTYAAHSHFIEPLGDNPTHNKPHNRYEAMGRYLLRMTSNTFISEIL